MLRRTFIILILLAYGLPPIVGDAGMHALLGVTHSGCGCCTLPDELQEASEELSCHSHCCGNTHCHSEQASQSQRIRTDLSTEERSEKNFPPASPVDTEDCSICKFFSQAQLEAEAPYFSEWVTAVEWLPVDAPSLPMQNCFSLHSPRGPPLCCS